MTMESAAAPTVVATRHVLLIWNTLMLFVVVIGLPPAGAGRVGRLCIGRGWCRAEGGDWSAGDGGLVGELGRRQGLRLGDAGQFLRRNPANAQTARDRAGRPFARG